MPVAAFPLTVAAPSGLVRPAVWLLAGFLAALGLMVALLWPEQIFVFFAVALGVAAVLVALAFPLAACALWLLAVGLTPDMWLGEMVGPGAGLVIIAALKFSGILLVGLAALRFGLVWDGFNPALAFVAMFGIGMMHGLHPNLAPDESLRSLLGSVAPFAFGFVRLPRRWAQVFAAVILLIPVLSVGLGLGLAGAGLRPVLVEGMGWRLQGAGHPAFLGGFALVACYASVLEWLRTGQWRFGAALVLNLLILLLSGARGPLAIGVVVVGLALVFVPAARLGWARRVPFLLGGGLVAVGLFAAAGWLSGMRVFNLLGAEAANLSGRDEIWPLFQAAWDASPVWGWGTGAGKVLVGVETPLARFLGTNAAHNEYLRIGVESGFVGLGLLVGFFLLWAWRHLRVLRGPDRWVMLLVLAGFAVHSATDNTLIATTASGLFAWITTVFARGAREAERKDA